MAPVLPVRCWGVQAELCERQAERKYKTLSVQRPGRPAVATTVDARRVGLQAETRNGACGRCTEKKDEEEEEEEEEEPAAERGLTGPLH